VNVVRWMKGFYYGIKAAIVLRRLTRDVRISGLPQVSAELSIGESVTINSSRGRVTKLVG